MKLIIFGGAFDPPHLGHLQMAYECHARFPAAKILVLPTAESPTPGKEVAASMEHRLNMLHCQFRECQKDGWLEISDLESRLSKPSYTLHTLNYLIEHSDDFFQPPNSNSVTAETPLTKSTSADASSEKASSEKNCLGGDRLALILGQDQWESFYQWHQPVKILEQCDLIVFSRDQRQQQRFFNEKLFGQSPIWLSRNHYQLGKAEIFFMDDKVCNAASREIRANIRSARSTEGADYIELSTNWVSGSVLDYIVNHGLYRG